MSRWPWTVENCLQKSSIVDFELAKVAKVRLKQRSQHCTGLGRIGRFHKHFGDQRHVYAGDSESRSQKMQKIRPVNKLLLFNPYAMSGWNAFEARQCSSAFLHELIETSLERETASIIISKSSRSHPLQLCPLTATCDQKCIHYLTVLSSHSKAASSKAPKSPCNETMAFFKKVFLAIPSTCCGRAAKICCRRSSCSSR